MLNEHWKCRLESLIDAVEVFLMTPAIALGGVVDCFCNYFNAFTEMMESVSFVIVGEYERFKDNRIHKREMKDTLAMIRAESIEYVRCLLENNKKEKKELIMKLSEWENLAHRYGAYNADMLEKVIVDLANKRW